MANTHTTLSSLFTDIADAIRSLKGTTASIVADDFPDEINAIPKKSSSDLTASGATVTAPAGYYASAASKSVAAGSAATPATTISSTPTISVSSVGLITASNSKTQSVTPTVSAGYVSAGTAGTITVSGSQTRQLLTKATETFTPGTTDQTIAKNVWTTGVQTIKGDANLVAENIAEGVTIFGVTGTHKGGGIKIPVFEPVTVPFNTGYSCQKMSYTRCSYGGNPDLFWFHGNNVLYSSEDGETWTYRGASGSQNIVHVEFDSAFSRFVTYNGSYVRYSTVSNPSSWANGSVASAICSLAKGDFYFVGLPQPATYTASGSTAGVTSVNGAAFSANASLLPNSMSAYDVEAIGDKMFAVGTYYSNGIVCAFKPAPNTGYSGIFASLGSVSSYGYGLPVKIVYDETNNKYVVLIYTGYIATSTNGGSFTTPTKIDSSMPNGVIMTDMVYAFGMLIAVGSASTTPYVYYSTDGGTTWFRLDFPYEASMGSISTTAIGNHRIAVGKDKIIIAPSGATTLYVADMS